MLQNADKIPDAIIHILKIMSKAGNAIMAGVTAMAADMAVAPMADGNI